MCQSRNFFLEHARSTWAQYFICALHYKPLQFFIIWNTCWRHSLSRGETKYRKSVFNYVYEHFQNVGCISRLLTYFSHCTKKILWYSDRQEQNPCEIDHTCSPDIESYFSFNVYEHFQNVGCISRLLTYFSHCTKKILWYSDCQEQNPCEIDHSREIKLN